MIPVFLKDELDTAGIALLERCKGWTEEQLVKEAARCAKIRWTRAADRLPEARKGTKAYMKMQASLMDEKRDAYLTKARTQSTKPMDIDVTTNHAEHPAEGAPQQ